MAERRCEECGSLIPTGANACPNCGCPVENVQENSQTDSNDGQQEVAFIHDNFNEKEPYSPFKSDSWFFRDPWPIRNYPKGALYQKHPLIDWLLGPWYLTCKDKKEQEEYDVINNIFYFLNLTFKIVAYSIIWWVLKIWWLILGLLLFSGMGGLIAYQMTQNFYLYDDELIKVVSIGGSIITAIIWVVAYIYGIIAGACAT